MSTYREWALNELDSNLRVSDIHMYINIDINLDTWLKVMIV